jgi:hypothetical protein
VPALVKHVARRKPVQLLQLKPNLAAKSLQPERLPLATITTVRLQQPAQLLLLKRRHVPQIVLKPAAKAETKIHYYQF